jgi:hypothetical protein
VSTTSLYQHFSGP